MDLVWKRTKLLLILDLNIWVYLLITCRISVFLSLDF